MPPVALESIGAFTSAGPSTAQTMAALCLGVKLFEEMPVHDARGEPVVGALSALPLGDAHEADRLVTLAALALEECGAARPDDRLPVLLCAPEPSAALPAPDDVLRALLAAPPVAVDARGSRVFAGGRTAFHAAFREALRLLGAAEARACYVGGVDSFVDRFPLDTALRAGRIKTSDQPEGFVPGEGAVFLRIAARPSGDVLATIAGFGLADEQVGRGSPDADHGGRLAAAARMALAEARADMEAVGLVVHDASGPRPGFREAALALARLRPRPDPAPAVWTPATVAGELGAAYGPLALAQAAFFLAKRVNPGPGALVLASAAGPTRVAAVVLEPQ